jgi:type IV secretory pathway VirB10-like protein
MEKVSVNKGLLIGIAAVAAASLLAVAFLLGRSSGSPSSSAQTPVREVPGPEPLPVSDPRVPDAPLPVPTPADAWVPFPVNPLPATGSAPVAAQRPAARQESPLPAPPPVAGEAARVESDAARASVAAYLDAVGRIQPATMNGDADSVANAMAASLAKGDTSELDRLTRETEAAKGHLAALTPPASCATHYRESLGSLDDALEMLRSMKAAMESPDPVAQLTGVASRATGLRSRAEALQREEQALRQRYGLTR